MKGRVLPFESDEHQRVELLLPWYVNGTLPESERQQVHAHLVRCTRCESERAFQSQLRDLGELPGMADHTALGWEALHARMQDRKTEASTVQRRRRWKGWPLAWGVQCAVSVALACVLVAVERQPEPYRALGAPGSAPAANVLVAFDPGATESQIRAALRAAGARLVDGPTVTDAYLLQVSRPEPRTLERLRAQPGVSTAESLDPASVR